MARTVFRPNKRLMLAHWDVLCSSIGVRLAGSAEEQAAADYIESQFIRFHLKDVQQQRFVFPNWWVKKLRLRVGRKQPTRAVPCGPWPYSPSTSDKGVSGDLVYLQAGSKLDFKGKKLKGKIGLTIGTLASLMDKKFKARLARSGLLGLLMVDTRIPYNDVCPGGCAPQWAAGLTVPMAAVPFRTAIELVNSLPLKAHLLATGRYNMDQSQNVIGQITGSRWPEQVIVVSAHHDSVWHSAGANDNAAGVVFILELARMLAKRRPARTIRFVSYGVEERLSVGAYVHARLLGREARNVRLVINADAPGSRVGVDRVLVTGSPQASRLLDKHYKACGHPAQIIRGSNIYSDQFPLNIYGVPSLFITRPSLGDGHWTLHTGLDSLQNIDAAVLARSVKTIAALLDQLASQQHFDIPRSLGKDLLPTVRRGARDAYLHPWPIRKRQGICTLMPPDSNWCIPN